MEYARHVLGMADADHEEYGPATSCLLISQLMCSLVGQTQTIHLIPGSRAQQIYHATEIVTEYFCNYGLNPDFRGHLERSELAITGIGAEGDVRVVELPHHRFFLATLFLPQWGSTAEQPNPLIVAYVQAVKASAPGSSTSGATSTRIVRDGDALKFAEKHCVFDSLLVPNSIVCPI